MVRALFALVLFTAGCETKGACDAPANETCVEGVPKAACASEGPNHEVRRFSPNKTCASLGYTETDGHLFTKGTPSEKQRNDALGFSIATPHGATFVTSSDTEIIRWVVPQPEGPFPVLCAVTIAPRDAAPKSLPEAQAAFEKSGAFKASAINATADGFDLSGVKGTDPKIAQFTARRVGAAKSGEATCTGPTDHAAQLRAVVGSLVVD